MLEWLYGTRAFIVGWKSALENKELRSHYRAFVVRAVRYFAIFYGIVALMAVVFSPIIVISLIISPGLVLQILTLLTPYLFDITLRFTPSVSNFFWINLRALDKNLTAELESIREAAKLAGQTVREGPGGETVPNADSKQSSLHNITKEMKIFGRSTSRSIMFSILLLLISIFIPVVGSLVGVVGQLVLSAEKLYWTLFSPYISDCLNLGYRDSVALYRKHRARLLGCVFCVIF